MKLSSSLLRWGTLFFFISMLYSLWSFTFTDPNLYYSSAAPFVQFQNMMWSIPLVWKSVTYVLIILLWMVAFTRFISTQKVSGKQLLLLGCFAILPLLFSNNALSHDVFNYIFNARMIVKYGADPHIQVALQFAEDTWTRFMHNVHTPAPYWYGWTALSLIPYGLGLGIFSLTYLMFRIWSVLAVLGLWGIYHFFHQDKKTSAPSAFWRDVSIVLLHPLFLIEFVSNTHNDLWMMVPALLSLYLVKEKVSMTKVLFSLSLLLLSISTKYVTAALIPIWLMMVIAQYRKESIWQFFQKWQWDLAALALFLPLLLPRSQFFHPWYLIWSMSFYPLMKSKIFKLVLLSLSISSLFRYVPWLWFGGFEYTATIALQQQLITWGGALVVLCVFLIVNRSNLQVEK